MSYYPEPDIHIRDKVKVDLSNYATKEDRTCYKYWTSYLIAKKSFIALQAEVDKLEINNIPNSLNNVKTKVDFLVCGKLKTIPVDLKNWIMKLLKTQNSTHWRQK